MVERDLERLLMLKSLIYSADIRAIHKKAETQSLNRDELTLVKLGEKVSETIIQGSFVRTVKTLKEELSFLWGFAKNDIVVAQRDNGAASKSQRIKKGREGTLAAMMDFDIFLYNDKIKQNKTIFVEAKKIDTPSQVEGDKKHYQRQLDCQERFRNMGFSVHLTNNPVYFDKVICEEIREFFK